MPRPPPPLPHAGEGAPWGEMTGSQGAGPVTRNDT